jgi:hypothetical protein
MKYELIQDDDCDCPIDKHDPVQITYWHRARTILGTESVDEARIKELQRQIKAGTIIAIPVWAYVHGGAMIKAAEVNPFSCPWDSGQSGIVYIDKKHILHEYGWKRMSPERLDTVRQRLKATVEEYSKWLQGDCWGYQIEEANGAVVDSLWGMIGREYAEKCAKEAMAALTTA